MKNTKHIIFFVGAFSVVLLDQLTKWIFNSLDIDLAVINNILHLTLVRNTGAGFGILKGSSFLIWIGLIVIGGILYFYDKMSKEDVVPLALILGGAFGNLIDRVFRGYVVDFIDFRIWPVFNVADIALTIGALLLIINIIKKK